ncbi:hypothetical protein ACP70R_008375 [Stipagrostis hirtigluma subsp. patula]
MIAAILLVLSITLLATATIADDHFLNTICSRRNYYYENSTYQANIELLTTMLLKNASSTPSPCTMGSVGAVPDNVYGLFLCRGDVGASDCRDCAAPAVQDAQQQCLNVNIFDKDVAVFYEHCLFRFSDQDFLDHVNPLSKDDVIIMSDMMPVFPGWDPNNTESTTIITDIIKVLLQETAKQAAYNSSWRFATGLMDVNSTFPSLYSLMQCTTDLTPSHCWECLKSISKMAIDEFAGKQGGRVLAVRCNLRCRMWRFLVIVMVVLLLPSAFCFTVSFRFFTRRREGSQNDAKMDVKEDEALIWGLGATSSEFTVYDFSKVVEATGNFSEENKLGQGGFGTVYKDETRRASLDWTKRLAIIEGIAQGLLYLHKHSRLRVIHRDLKASNILLDNEMNPKISDFGLAKIFSINDTERNTERIVGTYGYMAPEYASEGLFSIKSDVFSFGVLVLEIVSGKRTSSFHGYGDFINLLGHAWQLWNDGLCIQLMDSSLVTECHTLEMMKCITIVLLCVQENAADRPTMSDVVAMLSSQSMTLPEPKHPAYFYIRMGHEEVSTVSANDVTVSALDGR